VFSWKKKAPVTDGGFFHLYVPVKSSGRTVYEPALPKLQYPIQELKSCSLAHSHRTPSKLEVNKQPAKVFTVLIDPVVFLFNVFLVKKAEYAFLQLAGPFSGYDLHGFDLFLDSLIDDSLKLAVDLISFIVNVVKIEFEFGHGCSLKE
jgi:hypothetical protein